MSVRLLSASRVKASRWGVAGASHGCTPRLGRAGIEPVLVLDQTRSPPRMLAPELADPGLELRGNLVGTGDGSMGTVGQGPQTARFVAGDPVVDALARHP